MQGGELMKFKNIDIRIFRNRYRKCQDEPDHEARAVVDHRRHLYPIIPKQFIVHMHPIMRFTQTNASFSWILYLYSIRYLRDQPQKLFLTLRIYIYEHCLFMFLLAVYPKISPFYKTPMSDILTAKQVLKQLNRHLDVSHRIFQYRS